MKKTVCTAALVAMALILASCTTIAKGPTDEELVQQTLDQWAAGLVEKDLDKFLDTISESFEAGTAGGKEELAGFIQEGINAGYLEGAEVGFQDAEYALEESTCSVYPVDLMSDAGSVSVELILSKEDGTWLVSGMEIDGM